MMINDDANDTKKDSSIVHDSSGYFLEQGYFWPSTSQYSNWLINIINVDSINIKGNLYTNLYYIPVIVIIYIIDKYFIYLRNFLS